MDQQSNKLGHTVGHLFVHEWSNPRRHSLVIHHQFDFGRRLFDGFGCFDIGKFLVGWGGWWGGVGWCGVVLGKHFCGLLTVVCFF
jgi:hypothetical protein